MKTSLLIVLPTLHPAFQGRWAWLGRILEISNIFCLRVKPKAGIVVIKLLDQEMEIYCVSSCNFQPEFPCVCTLDLSRLPSFLMTLAHGSERDGQESQVGCVTLPMNERV